MNLTSFLYNQTKEDKLYESLSSSSRSRFFLKERKNTIQYVSLCDGVKKKYIKIGDLFGRENGWKCKIQQKRRDHRRSDIIKEMSFCSCHFSSLNLNQFLPKSIYQVGKVYFLDKNSDFVSTNQTNPHRCTSTYMTLGKMS